MHRYIGSRHFYRRLFAVMLPILIQTVITNFVNLLDNIMVGQVGTEPMSGVAIITQLLFVFNLCIFGGLAGAGIFTAQYYGAGDEQGVAESVRAKLFIALGTVLVFAAIFVFAGDKLIAQFIHPGGEALDLEATRRHAADYLRIMLIQMPPFALQMVYATTLRETGETLLPMKAGMAAVLVNLTLNYILIFGKLGMPALGVEGAAIATVIARFTECGIVVFFAHRSSRGHFLARAWTSWRIPASLARAVAVTGLPLLLNELLWSSGQTFLNQCYSVRGLEVVSALSISTTVSNLFFTSFIAMGNAIGIIVGQLLGAGELERAVDEDRKLIAFAVALCTLVGAVMALIAPYVPRVYNTTESVHRLAGRLLLVTAATMPFHGFANACYFTMRAGGRATLTFAFDSGWQWLIVIPLAFVLSRFTAVPILPMFAAVAVAESVKCLLGWYFVKRGDWVRDLVN
ncbi:MAG: MATE family efflux transporter [Oscillospiraceae bacterium]|nr:MATE family efflux transporter [Oscillospiraceae bacterium]